MLSSNYRGLPETAVGLYETDKSQGYGILKYSTGELINVNFSYFVNWWDTKVVPIQFSSFISQLFSIHDLLLQSIHQLRYPLQGLLHENII